MHRGIRNASLSLESLESRRLFAVTASFAGGVLTVLGDNGSNAITVSRDVAGNLKVNDGAVPIAGSPATLGNTQLVSVAASGGHDSVTLDEANGLLPKSSISGGSGNDRLTGGAGADTLNGDSGNDVLLGKGGDDSMLGGDGNDTLTGGAGTDRAFGQAGNDRMIWNPGDGSDLNEGGDGFDIVDVIGGNVTEAFSVIGVGDRALFERIDPLPFTIDIGTSEKLVLNANGGDDSFFGGTGLAGRMVTQVDGGAGNDTIVGTDGIDTLLGGDGNDFIDGNAGADLVKMGAGDDVFRWDPGDGSDTVEGQSGRHDVMLFNGADLAEKVELSASQGRLRFVRDLGNITMDVNDVEDVQFNAKGGADSILVRNLRGTDVRSVGLNLEGTPGAGDGAVDSIVVEGSSAGEIITVGGKAKGVSVNGLGVAIGITGVEASDKLNVKTLGGDDLLVALELDANVIRFTADGGEGKDLLIGSAGNDTLLGGTGNDILIGAAGTDQLDGGPGLDITIQ